MARSKRKSPCTGVTTARSEKYDKRLANRRLRKRSRMVLARRRWDDDLIFPLMREVSNVWCMDKDGRVWWGWSDNWTPLWKLLMK